MYVCMYVYGGNSFTASLAGATAPLAWNSCMARSGMRQKIKVEISPFRLYCRIGFKLPRESTAHTHTVPFYIANKHNENQWAIA